MKTITFTAIESKKECKGCIFENEKSTVCFAASAAAVDEGLPDCEQTPPGGGSYIYVVLEEDPRQLSIVEQKRTAEYAFMACATDPQ